MHAHAGQSLSDRAILSAMVPSQKDRQRLGLVLRKMRERVGLSEDAVAAQLCKPVSWINELEAGSVAVSVHELVAIAIAYGSDQPTLLQEFTRTRAVPPPLALALSDSELDLVL